MKNITALIALISLMGLAGAQGSSFLGEGYSSSQTDFFNEPSTSTFDTFVQTYWSRYVAGEQNQSSINLTTEMGMWMNHFPLLFSTPLDLRSTSFKSNVTTQGLSEKDMKSQALKTEVYRKLGLNEVSSYRADSGILDTGSGTGMPAVDATEKVVAQSVMSFFNV